MLRKLIELFGEARDLVRTTSREILITLRGDAPHVGVSVDAIHRVGAIATASIEPIPGGRSSQGAVTHVARTGDEGDVIMLLDAPFIEARLGVGRGSSLLL